MPRASRNLTDNGYYHVLSRGNNKKDIFCSEEDHIKFLTIISKYLEKYNISIYHYCLMPNHFHFLLKAEKAIHLPKFMQGILQSYAWHYRRRYDTVGFLFQNRYRSLKSNDKRQQRFQEYVLQTRPHDQLLDNVFKIE
jgi:putative transposase